MAKEYNCTKNGIQYYRKVKTIGHKADGSPIKKEFYGDGKKDAERQVEEYMNKIKSGLNVNVENMTVEEGMHEWLFTVLIHSKNKKSATFEKHECNFRNYIKDKKIGRIKIQNAVSLPFQQYYNDIYKKGITIQDTKTGSAKHYIVSENKIFDLNKTLRAFFNYCIQEKYTTTNPCSLSNIELVGDADGGEDYADDEGNNIQIFTDNEMDIIKKSLTSEKDRDATFSTAIQLGFVTGLRLGELLGLKKKFVSENFVKVRNTLKRVKVYDSTEEWHYETKLIKPKSTSSIRTVHYPQQFSNILKQYLKEQEDKWKENGLDFNDDSLVFTTNSCQPFFASNFARAWRRFLKRNKITYRKPHSMRDQYATTLVRRGASIHDVKDLLGHSSIKITEKYYIFVFPEDKSNVANLLNDFVIKN